MRVFSLIIITTYPDISLQTELTLHIIYSVHDMNGARFSRYMLPAKLHARTLSSTGECHPFFCQLAFFFFCVLTSKKSDDDGRDVSPFRIYSGPWQHVDQGTRHGFSLPAMFHHGWR